MNLSNLSPQPTFFDAQKDIFTASKSHAKLVSKCLIMSAEAVVLGIAASNEAKVGKGKAHV